MPESYAFSTIREMMNDTSNNFLLVCQKDYYSLCKSYATFVKKILPAHYKVMESCGALDPKNGGLDPIFKRFFATLLKRDVSICFIDCKDDTHLLSFTFKLAHLQHSYFFCIGHVTFYGYILG